MEQFSWFDIITISLIALLAVKGIINGFIKEVFGLLGIIGGIYLASRYADVAGQWIDANFINFENKGSLFLIGFIAILLTIWVLSIFLGYMISKLISMSGLGFLDKMAGFIVGGAKIFLVFSVLLVTISNISFIQENLNKYLKNSFMYPIFLEAGKYIVTKNNEHFQAPKINNTNNIDINTSLNNLNEQEKMPTNSTSKETQ